MPPPPSPAATGHARARRDGGTFHGRGDPVATLSSRQDRKGVPGCGATLPPGEGPTVPQMQEAKHIRVLLRHLLDLGFMINVDKGMLAPAQDVAFWYYPWTR